MTGAEALQKILETVESLSATVNELKTSVLLIEQSIKVLNNRAGGLMRQHAEVGFTPNPVNLTVAGPVSAMTTSNMTLSAGVPAQHSTQTLQAVPARGRQMKESPPEQRDEAMNFIKEADGPGTITYKRVFGKLVNNTSEPIENVLVKVFDRNNEVCATTETDPIGYWETMLKPGRYVAEYTKSGFKTSNKTFEVGKGAKEVEVK